MMEQPKLVSVPYAECRRKYFQKLKQHEENRLKYWARFAGHGYLTEKAEWALYDAGDNISFLEDAIAELDRPELVHCVDCINHGMADMDTKEDYIWCKLHRAFMTADNFCKNGERKVK